MDDETCPHGYTADEECSKCDGAFQFVVRSLVEAIEDARASDTTSAPADVTSGG
jgi:hypothetical protein